MFKKSNFCNKKNSSIVENQKRKTYFKTMFIEKFSTLKKLFRQLQRNLTILNIFEYFNHIRLLIIKIDDSKKRNYNVKIYYVKNYIIDDNI